MSNRILVTPEQLNQVSSQFSQSGQQSSDIVQRLQQSIQQMEGQWEGITRERFYGEYQQARITMNKFIECLHTVSTELNQISVKFRTADESNSGPVVGASMTGTFAAGTGIGAMAVGAGALGSAGVGGTARAAGDKSLVDKMIDGVKVEGSMVENKEGGWYTKAISGSAEASLMNGASAEASIVEAGYENDYVEGSVSVAKAEVEASIKDGTLSLGAEATLNKYEGGVKIPLPFTDKELNIGGSASLGVVGASAEVGKTGLKFHIPLGPGASLVGVGGAITVE
ncbi:WXG100 family type VII secretion target [Paenibacillus uliginis N3/975]|uniref:WXG100 family type VII secretion target n=1 Tax=Paenibacillus uliginis N3/975 TaxID=1313296 RepID=A0A1X7HBM6_9BACL|nr:WXG100 family type VII secretion target [Paenibacillus uliginis]SMF82705.1 WXG100 family type VII secretion target [Paenibacillus uliginis N3/975]